MNTSTRFALAACFFLFSFNAFSQDYMDVIATNSCGCVSKLVEANERKNLEMKLGLCMLEAAKPYEKQLKADYDLDLSRIDQQGEKLGRIVGVKIATLCPDSFIALTNLLNADGEATPADEMFEGEVVGIDDKQFVVFTLKDASGKTSNFYWMNFFPSDVNLVGSYNRLIKKKIKVNYIEQEYFDPRIKEYKKYNVITSLNTAQ